MRGSAAAVLIGLAMLSASVGGGTVMKLDIAAFQDGARMPKRYTCQGEDISPAITWSGAPAGTRSLVLLMDDPDAPVGTWRHWGVYDIPPDVQGLAEGLARTAQEGALKQAMNDFGRPGYGGPCPPPGHGIHHYHFRLLALKVDALGLPPGADYREVEAAAKAQALAEAKWTGLYSR
jgi:Raf kinase inhibitor-like YbhB/YbcL family protein